jgi:hypothetical protein
VATGECLFQYSLGVGEELKARTPPPPGRICKTPGAPAAQMLIRDGR